MNDKQADSKYELMSDKITPLQLQIITKLTSKFIQTELISTMAYTLSYRAPTLISTEAI